MAGGILNILAYGAQDLFLTGKPQLTYFKQVWRQYTNFGIESIRQNITGNVDFGNRVTCAISKSADMVHKMILQVTVPAVAQTSGSGAVRWVDRLGHALVKSYSLEISGHVIDYQYGEWLEIWTQLTLPASKAAGYANMIGHVTSLHTSATNANYTLYVPLQLWFCQDPSLSLPLVSLQNADVKVFIEFRQLSELLIQQTSTDVFTGSMVDAAIYADMIYLDELERQRFSTGTHEYLINQLQLSGPDPLSVTVSNTTVNFSHPVKMLAWVVQRDEMATNGQYFNFTTTLQNRSVASGTFADPIDLLDGGANQGTTNSPVYAAGTIAMSKLVLNSKDRMDSREGGYFNRVQPYQWFDRIPSSPGIYVYSFALNPVDAAQPSGSINFTKLDNAVLYQSYESSLFNVNSDGTTPVVRISVYALNYNLFRVYKGQAGVGFVT